MRIDMKFGFLCSVFRVGWRIFVVFLGVVVELALCRWHFWILRQNLAVKFGNGIWQW
ncbi:MAG: hypothetical protein MSH23_04075 [Campylobacter lanienae]|uniref:hypothetical protein n=1 Tax=Campylobacter lanienae TaxID=75658 RepID=UPI00242ADE53|nr:hypothetical protein [Campylobacter lanienae]MCI7364190.1 hypothetical protein [Campylobacter lanienae]